MEAKITFHLRKDRVSADGRHLIEFRVCWGSLKVRGSTGQKIHPTIWDEGSQRVRRNAVVAKVINRRITIYADRLDDFFSPRLESPTEAEVIEEVERIRTAHFGKKAKAAPVASGPAHPTFREYATSYCKLRRAERSKSWVESVSVVASHLAAFRTDLDWPDLKLNTLNQFTAYLQDDCEHSDATLETYVSLMRGMLSYALRLGYPVPPDYQFVETRSVGDTLRPVLNHQDIAAIASVTLSNTSDNNSPTFLDALEATRWYFLLATATGLRYSDLHQLLHPSIIYYDKTPCLQVVQKKTGRGVPIPLSEQTLELLRHPKATGKPACMEMYMIHLRHIGQQAKLNRLVSVGSYYKGEQLIDTLPLWETLTSHMARRTFGSLMTQGGLPTRVLQELMGHKSIASTEKYASVSNQAIINQSIAAWNTSKNALDSITQFGVIDP